jgi:hypothetical protein
LTPDLKRIVDALGGVEVATTLLSVACTVSLYLAAYLTWLSMRWGARLAKVAVRGVARWWRPEPSELCRAVLDALLTDADVNLERGGDGLRCGRVKVWLGIIPRVYVGDLDITRYLATRELRAVVRAASCRRDQIVAAEEAITRELLVEQLRGGV